MNWLVLIIALFTCNVGDVYTCGDGAKGIVTYVSPDKKQIQVDMELYERREWLHIQRYLEQLLEQVRTLEKE